MTTIECPFWKNIGSDSFGECRLGLYGGRPSTGVCLQCLGRASHAKAVEARPRTPGCRSCEKTKIQTWLGVRWHGTPWPKRWKVWGGWLCYMPEKGCGCIVKLKALVDGIRHLIRTVGAA